VERSSVKACRVARRAPHSYGQAQGSHGCDGNRRAGKDSDRDAHLGNGLRMT